MEMNAKYIDALLIRFFFCMFLALCDSQIGYEFLGMGCGCSMYDVTFYVRYCMRETGMTVRRIRLYDMRYCWIYSTVCDSDIYGRVINSSQGSYWIFGAILLCLPWTVEVATATRVYDSFQCSQNNLNSEIQVITKSMDVDVVCTEIHFWLYFQTWYS